MLVCKAKTGKNRDRRGAVALEFAIVLPLFLTLLFGIVEFGRAIMVHQILVNAAREGARKAIVPDAQDEQVYQIVDNYLNVAGITGHTRAISINGENAGLSTAASHDAVAITVEVPYGQVSWGFTSFLAPEAMMRANVVMRKE